MPLKNSIQKTKCFLHKTLLALKLFLSEGYRNLSKTLILNPSSNSNSDQKSNPSNDICPEFSIQWEPDHHQENTKNAKKETRMLPRAADANYLSGRSMKIADEATVKKRQAQKNEGKRRGASCKCGNAGNHALAQKMKELNMVDMGDVHHSLDVEEALHYYSRLTSPVYLDIVDEFFMDMYREFFLPQPSGSLTSSSRRVNSNRRLGPLVL
ncbi:hypothetical protein Ancab_029480 [Ancistrocladus abbreviatus]